MSDREINELLMRCTQSLNENAREAVPYLEELKELRAELAQWKSLAHTREQDLHALRVRYDETASLLLQAESDLASALRVIRLLGGES